MDYEEYWILYKGHPYEKLNDKTKSFIKENKLSLAESNFDTPVDFVHEALAESQQDEFYYMYYKYKYLFSQIKVK